MSLTDSNSVHVIPEPVRLVEPKNRITFIAQIFLIFIIVIVSLINLCLSRPDRELWLLLLSSSIGYILPNPSLKFSKKP